MLAHYLWEIHAWVYPLTFATGWVLGYYQFRRRYPEQWEQMKREEKQ